MSTEEGRRWMRSEGTGEEEAGEEETPREDRLLDAKWAERENVLQKEFDLRITELCLEKEGEYLRQLDIQKREMEKGMREKIRHLEETFEERLLEVTDRLSRMSDREGRPSSEERDRERDEAIRLARKSSIDSSLED